MHSSNIKIPHVNIYLSNIFINVNGSEEEEEEEGGNGQGKGGWERKTESSQRFLMDYYNLTKL